MKPTYVQTDFAEITPTIRRAWEIKSHAQGRNLIPLAKGESAPDDATETPEQPSGLREWLYGDSEGTEGDEQAAP